MSILDTLQYLYLDKKHNNEFYNNTDTGKDKEIVDVMKYNNVGSGYNKLDNYKKIIKEL